MSTEADLAAPPVAANRSTRAPRGAGVVGARIYRRVLADILHGRLAPGRTLRLVQLASAYGASTGTLREVLIRLAGERLVVRDDDHGFRIAPASQADLFELIKTIAWVEEIGIRESIANGDALWELDLIAAHRALARPAAPNVAPARAGLSEADELVLDYHAALVGACRSSILVAHCRDLNQHLLRYMNVAAGALEPHRAELDALLAIGSAALQRDVARAASSLKAYVAALADDILASATLS